MGASPSTHPVSHGLTSHNRRFSKTAANGEDGVQKPMNRTLKAFVFVHANCFFQVMFFFLEPCVFFFNGCFCFFSLMVVEFHGKILRI